MVSENAMEEEAIASIPNAYSKIFFVFMTLCID